MSIIMHNVMAINAQRQFNITEKKKSKNYEKLSSGYKVNRSADDAAGLSISEKMRSQIRNLNQATKNVEDGIGLTKTADAVLQEVHNILHRQRELLVKAANDTNCDEDRQAIEDELIQLMEEEDRIFDTTKFNGRYLFKGKNTIIEGPTVTNPEVPDEVTTTNRTDTSNEVVWLPKSPAPDTSTKIIETETDGVVSTGTYYFVEETSEGEDDWGRETFYKHTYYDNIETSKNEKVKTTTSFEEINDSAYTELRTPGSMTGSRGYINVKNVAGNLDLSCAMSQLGVKVDGVLNSFDLYNNSNAITDASDPNNAITTYDLGDGLSLKQTIQLSDNKYTISYAVENSGANDHLLDVRLAFDTMNAPFTTVKDNDVKTFSLQNEYARIPIDASSADKATLGLIDSLYDEWDDSGVIGGQNITDSRGHSGVGAWWEGRNVGAGETLNIGSLTYGPIELLADPYMRTVVTETQTTLTDHIEREDTVIRYMPEYLMIQDGANAGEHFPIRLHDLSTENMKCRVPDNVSAFTASDSLQHMDRANQTISSIRSYYGAMTNRMETIINANQNYSENLEASESNIRDTDMANELMDLAKHSILEQAGQAMLAQANMQNQGILQLLQ